MQKDNATIKGVMHARPRSTRNGAKAAIAITGPIRAENQKIHLIPLTDYVKDYIRLKHNEEKPKKEIFAELHPEVFDLRYEAETNSNGEFTFPNMKPGKYYLFGKVKTATITKNKYVNNGTVAKDNYGQVIATGYDYYKTYNPIYDYADNIIEITNDGSTINVVVSDQKKDFSQELLDLIKNRQVLERSVYSSRTKLFQKLT